MPIFFIPPSFFSLYVVNVQKWKFLTLFLILIINNVKKIKNFQFYTNIHIYTYMKRVFEIANFWKNSNSIKNAISSKFEQEIP